MIYYLLVMVVLFVGLPVACHIGYRVGHRTRVRRDDTAKSHAAGWQGALLGLAALLIGFTFVMAQARYDARKQIILAEANHIGTTYLRTRLLDDGPGEELRALLRRYVDERLELAAAGADRARIERAIDRSTALEEQIWSRVVAAGRADPHSIMIGMLVDSTNSMIDTGEEHLAALVNPLPPAVFLVLILVSIVAMASAGYLCGLAGRLMVLGMWVMPVLLATVIALVFDLAHPRLGIVRVHDPILTRLKQSF